MDADFEAILGKISYYGDRILRCHGASRSQPWLGRIDQLTIELDRALTALAPASQDTARAEIIAYDIPFLNPARLTNVSGVAFCHAFSPDADSAAYAASLRLRQIAAMHGAPVSWHVFRAPAPRADFLFQELFASRQCARITEVGKRAGANARMQYLWGEEAFTACKLAAPMLYSLDRGAASHYAALLYKRAHPEAFWYAEFFLDDRVWRQPASYRDIEHFSASRSLPKEVMEQADCLIFSSTGQMERLIAGNPLIACKASIRAKSRVLPLPTAPKWLGRISHYRPFLDKNRLNIGYFANGFPGVELERLFTILRKHCDAHLHVWCARPVDFELPHDLRAKITMAEPLFYLDYLSARKNMDAYFVKDMPESAGASNLNTYGAISALTNLYNRKFALSPLSSRMEH